MQKEGHSAVSHLSYDYNAPGYLVWFNLLFNYLGKCDLNKNTTQESLFLLLHDKQVRLQLCIITKIKAQRDLIISGIWRGFVFRVKKYQWNSLLNQSSSICFLQILL